MKKKPYSTKPLTDILAKCLRDYWEEEGNILAAECLRNYWREEGGPVVVIDHRPRTDDPFIVKLLGPGKPTETDPTGQIDIYTTSVYLLDVLAYYALEDTLVNVSDNPKHQTYDLDDVKDRCQALRHLAQCIIDLADEIEGKAA